MLVDVTAEKVGVGVSVAGVLLVWTFSLIRSRFVTRKEWHDANNATSGIIGTIQNDIASINAQLASCDKQIGSMEGHINSIDASSRAALESTARIEGILLGKESSYKRKGAQC